MKTTALSKLPVESVSHNPAIKKQVMLRLGDLPHPTNFSQAQFQPGHVAAARAHADMHEVFLVEASEGIIDIDGKPCALTLSVCVAVAPHESHEVSNTGDDGRALTYFGLRA